VKQQTLVISPPDFDEWDTSDLPADRRAYLDSRQTFSVITDAALNEAQVLKARIEPYRNPPKGVTRAKQICFRIRVSKRSYDLFYNSPDGLRGRYWQSADAGDEATRYFINALETMLVKFANDAHLDSTFDVNSSLAAPSAKTWVCEKGDAENSLIAYDMPQLRVRRWQQNENEQGGKGMLWRWTPYLDEIEIKGGIIDSKGVEHIPESKRDRALQIYRFGFT
jgi:hypothetical protein